MYSVGAAISLSVLCLVWLLILSWGVWKQRSENRQLFPKDANRDIRNRFKEVLEEFAQLLEREQLLNKKIAEARKEGLGAIQKVAVLRYNPYQDTGGDQSFSLVLLDGNSNGVILTSLHSRASTRVYTKSISNAKADLELSKEEQQVLAKALND